MNLLICDYHLGGHKTDVDAIQAVRQATRPDLPTIQMSGDTSSVMRQASSSVEWCHLLGKPVDADHLLELTARLLSDAQTSHAPCRAKEL